MTLGSLQSVINLSLQRNLHKNLNFIEKPNPKPNKKKYSKAIQFHFERAHSKIKIKNEETLRT